MLRPLQWGTKEAASAVFQLADEVADVYARSRLAWKRAVQDDLHRLAKWVTAEQAPPPEGEPQAPSAVASNWAQIWEGRWLSNHFDAYEAKQLCDSVIEQRPSVELTVTTDHLINAMRKSVGKAAGADAWFAADLLRLPDSFVRALLEFWNLCLDVAQLPRAWQTVRVALLPKEDGGMRPLAIASVLYRVCMTATVKALRTWSRSWLPSELYGGVEGRGAHGVHSALFHALREYQNSRLLVGYKADIKRCFDSIDYETVFYVFSKLGAPPRLTSLLRQFYAVQTRWFGYKGTVFNGPIKAERGLLQGCPASPLLLNALMSVGTGSS